jgi:hypothetical protein
LPCVSCIVSPSETHHIVRVVATIMPVDARDVTVSLKVHETTGVEYWALLAAKDFAADEMGPAMILPVYRPQDTRRRGSVAIRFIEELHTGRVQPGIVAFLTEAWWNEAFPNNTTFKTFKDSGVTVIGATMGIWSGLLPPPAPSR